jgi:hypothetical protein
MSKADVIPDTARPEALVVVRPDGGPSFLERWIHGDPSQALARVDAMTAVLERLRLKAIQQTWPSDWVIQASVKDGVVQHQTGYLQDIGCDRAGKVYGIVVGEPIVHREDLPDGTYVYELQARASSYVTHETIETCFGSRWSGDTFFVRQLKDPDDKVDPTDVKKAAYANLHGRAVRALGGLAGVPLEALEAAGLDIKRCRYVGYEQGVRGGTSVGASTGAADLVVRFGRASGKKPSELEAKDLDWYIDALKRNLADPARERFRKQDEPIYRALLAEREARDQKKAHEAATGPSAPEETGEIPANRGGRIAMLNARMLTAATEQRKVLPLLRQLTQELFDKESGSFQDLADEQLEALLHIDPADLARLQASLDKPKP